MESVSQRLRAFDRGSRELQKSIRTQLELNAPKLAKLKTEPTDLEIGDDNPYVIGLELAEEKKRRQELLSIASIIENNLDKKGINLSASLTVLMFVAENLLLMGSNMCVVVNLYRCVFVHSEKSALHVLQLNVLSRLLRHSRQLETRGSDLLNSLFKIDDKKCESSEVFGLDSLKAMSLEDHRFISHLDVLVAHLGHRARFSPNQRWLKQGQLFLKWMDAKLFNNSDYTPNVQLRLIRGELLLLLGHLHALNASDKRQWAVQDVMAYGAQKEASIALQLLMQRIKPSVASEVLRARALGLSIDAIDLRLKLAIWTGRPQEMRLFIKLKLETAQKNALPIRSALFLLESSQIDCDCDDAFQSELKLEASKRILGPSVLSSASKVKDEKCGGSQGQSPGLFTTLQSTPSWLETDHSNDCNGCDSCNQPLLLACVPFLASIQASIHCMRGRQQLYVSQLQQAEHMSERAFSHLRVISNEITTLTALLDTLKLHIDLKGQEGNLEEVERLLDVEKEVFSELTSVHGDTWVAVRTLRDQIAHDMRLVTLMRDQQLRRNHELGSTNDNEVSKLSEQFKSKVHVGNELEVPINAEDFKTPVCDRRLRPRTTKLSRGPRKALIPRHQ